jgi:hypothetical protein
MTCGSEGNNEYRRDRRAVQGTARRKGSHPFVNRPVAAIAVLSPARNRLGNRHAAAHEGSDTVLGAPRHRTASCESSLARAPMSRRHR